MRKKIVAWTLLGGCLFLLSSASSPYMRNAERVLLPLRLLLLAGISLLVIREWWRDRCEARAGRQSPRNDAARRFLRSIRRWYYGDLKPH
jgi:hypothetical protein